MRPGIFIYMVSSTLDEQDVMSMEHDGAEYECGAAGASALHGDSGFHILTMCLHKSSYVHLAHSGHEHGAR